MFITGRLQYGKGILQEKQNQLQLLMQEVKWQETMFYKGTDYANHENGSAVAVPSRFESYLASPLFIEEK